MNYPTIAAAASALSQWGVSGHTEFRVFAGTYSGPVRFDSIPGAGPSASIAFVRASDIGSVILQSTGSDSAVVIFSGGSYVSLDNLEIVAGGSVLRGITIGLGSHNVSILNCTLRGNLLSTGDGILLRGAGCNSNVFSKLTIRKFADAFDLDGLVDANSGTVVEECHLDSVRRGVVAVRQNGLAVNGNDILVNAGSVEEVEGVLIGTTWPQDTIMIAGNKIHSITTSGPFAVGVRVRTDSAAAVVRVFNNFIYDFQTSGSSQARAIFASTGRLELMANNINVNNSPSTGSSYAVLITTSASSGSTELRNNILVNRELTNLAYDIFAVSTSILLSSDYNIFLGTGSNYHLGRWGTDCNNLAAWRTASLQDFNSLAGNPGYISQTNLHLSPNNGLAHLNGTAVSFVSDDIDGEARGIPPDIGADEYAYNAPPIDLAVRGFYSMAPSYPELTPVAIKVIVQNRGSQSQLNAPLSLYFNNESVAEMATSLAASATDTVTLTWTTPSAPATGVLRAVLSASGDAMPQNDTVSTAVSIVPPPLNGTFAINATSGYATFAEAVNDLTTRGISGEVIFEVTGTFNENVTLPSINGADASTPIIFRSTGSPPAVLTASSGTATLLLDGADHIIFDGLNLAAAGTNPTAIQLINGACDNVFENAAITGSSLSLTSARGVFLTGGGNNRNLFSNLILSGAFTGLDLNGSLQQPDSANTVENCTIETSRYGARATYAIGAIFHRNLIHAGYPGATATCVGIMIGSLRAGDAAYLEGNNFTGGRASASCYAIRSEAGTGTVKIRNNFISDWNVGGSGLVCGIAAVSGTACIDFNSFWMNDVASTGTVFAIIDSSSSTVYLRNNIFQISEADAPARALMHLNGPLTSDHNAFNGPLSNPQFLLAISGGVSYPTLASWQAGSGQDVNSIPGDPGFISTTDLHILSSSTLVSNRGLSLGENVPDFDGELRANPPDIGADEYDVMLITRDLGLSWAAPPDSQLAANAPFNFDVRLWNATDSSVTNVPVRLFFNEVLVDSAMASVAARDTITITLHWTTPDTGLAFGDLRAQVFLPQDQNPVNDLATANVILVGSPMNGLYTVGAGNSDFAGLPDAIEELHYRGVAGAVTVTVAFGSHVGALVIPTIPGTSAASPVTLEASAPGTVLTADSGAAVITFDGAAHIVLHEFDFLPTGGCPGGVLIRGGADSNLVSECQIAGSDPSNSATFGVGVRLDHNDGNTLDHLSISDVYTAIAFQNGPSSSFCNGNRVRFSNISLARYGIYVDNQQDCEITNCDLRPGSSAPVAGACYGVYIASLGTGGSCTVAANRIHGFLDNSSSTTNRAVGVYCGAAGGATARVFNNFIYDFSGIPTLKISAIYLSIGTNVVLHNSILLNDAPTTNEISGIYVSSGSDHDIRDNIIVSREAGVTSYGILCNGSGLASNYNDLYGTSPLFVTGRFAGTNYPQLSQWQTLGFDSNSIAANPGFISDQNLHITSTDSTVNSRGILSPLVLTDIDGQPRQNPPDLGADEYQVGVELSPIQNLTIRHTPADVVLDWSPIAGASFYSVYAASTPDVQVIPENFQSTVTQTSYSNPMAADALRFYVVVANP
jgi:hypothetical protein